ncbi:MAG: sulfite exporter TauE/SafE family protein [Clostridia bacterium]|nr:sulfite exporter TauE/SafE family protein [Clostridia bacterium]
MAVNAQMYLIVCPLVFLASVVDSIGGGGGLISLPAYLLAGLPAHMASGTNKFSACMGTALATARFFKSGVILLKPALAAACLALPTSYLGAWAQCLTPEYYVRVIMLVAIPIVAFLTLIRRDTREKNAPVTAKTIWICMGVGAVLGFYDGFFGPGMGTFLILAFIWLAGMQAVSASGSAKVVNLASNLAALVSFAVQGQILYQLAIPAAICSIAGGYIGASLALKVGARLVRFVMVAVLALVIVKLAADMFA